MQLNGYILGLILILISSPNDAIFYFKLCRGLKNLLRGSQYTTLITPTEKIVGRKVLLLIHTMKIKKILSHKTLWCTYTTTSSRERDELRQELHLRSQFS